MRKRTIKIYLSEGDPRGIKECTISNSIVKAQVIPRTRINKINELEELKSPGVYFLIINTEQDFLTKPDVYIGETEDLRKRIKQHQSKDWKLVICFYSAIDNEINKAHVKFLENYSYNFAKKLNRFTIYNEKGTTAPTLSNSDKDLVLDFFDDLKIMIAALGYPIFEETKAKQKDIIYCEGKDAFAEGIFTEEGLTVYEGSICTLKESSSAGTWIISARNELKKQGILIEKNNVLKFTKNHLFSSPSAAAAVVLARRANGWIEWKNKNSKSINEILRKNNTDNIKN